MLGSLVERAAKRYQEYGSLRTQLFNEDELNQLAAQIAATRATGELLGRARIRRRLDQARTHKHGERFSEAPTDLSCFAEDIHPMAPTAALAHFANLVPSLNVSADHFEKQHQAEAFKLAEATDAAMLNKVKGAIQKGLEQGQPRQAVASVQQILDDAGVSPKNPQYAEMVFRTNAMSAYNAGSTKEMQDPDVAESFPVWQYIGIEDGRQGEDHEVNFNNYYPNEVDFDEVRGDRVYNCRCSTIPIYVDDWNDLQADGAEVSTFHEHFSAEQARDEHGRWASAGASGTAEKMEAAVTGAKSRKELATSMKSIATEARDKIKSAAKDAVSGVAAHDLEAHPPALRKALASIVKEHTNDLAKDLIGHVDHETRYTIGQLKGGEGKTDIREVLGSAHDNLGPAGVKEKFDFNAQYLHADLKEMMAQHGVPEAAAQGHADQIVKSLGHRLGVAGHEDHRERPARAAELRAYLERFCGGPGSGRPGPCPGEGSRLQTGPTTTAAPVERQPLTETQLHQAADQESKKTIGLFGRMMASVKNLPVVKQLTQLHSYAQLQAVHLYNGLASRYGTANANAILAKGTFAGAGAGFALAMGPKLATIAAAGVAEAYRAMMGKHAEQDGQQPVDMALVDREAAKFLAQLSQQIQAKAGGQEFAELATFCEGGDCDGDVCAGNGGRRGGNVAGAGTVLLPPERSARLTELRAYLERFCGGKGSGRPGPCPEPHQAGAQAAVEPGAAEKVLGQQIAGGIRGRLKAGVGKILSGIDSATHGSISLLAAGHPAQAAAQAFNSVFHSVHQEVYEAALSEHSVPGAAVVAGVGAKVATAAQRGLLKGVSWAMGKLVGKHDEATSAGRLSAADVALLGQLTDLTSQELASLGLQPDRARLAGRILATLRSQQPATKHAEIPARSVPQSRSWTCGPAALASAAQALGLPITEQQAQQAVGATPDEGTPPERLLAGARALGLRARAHERMELSDLEAEIAAGYPVIVCMVAAWEPSAEVTDDSGHWAVITGTGPEGITLADPAAGKVRLTAEEFVRRWKDKDDEGREYVRLGIVVGR